MTSPPSLPDGLTPPTGADPRYVGDYRVVGRLGSGGMGTVYAAVDGSDTPVALKVVHAEYAADDEFRARFAREVDLLRRVAARCVPRFYGADTEARRPWLATEFVPGHTLRQHVAERGVFHGDMLLGLAAGMAEALAAIHGSGIVHRDLKPGNVIAAPDGPKVLDFGIARAVEESAITRTGGLFGTPGWIAPEQYEGAEPAAASDMFAWGGLVAFAATGRNPFGTGATDALAYRTMEEEPDIDGLPEPLRPLVEAALAKDPAQRPAAEQALSEVTRAWTGQTPSGGEEATRILPGLLDAGWTEAPGSGPGANPEAGSAAAAWASLAPPKRSPLRQRKVLIPAAAALALVLVGAAGALAWQASGGDGTDTGESTADGSGDTGDSADAEDDPGEIPDLGHGGADLGAADPASLRDISWVSNQYDWETHDGALHLEVAEALGEAGGVGQGDPMLRLTFDGAEPEGDAVRFSGEAEFLLDEGSYTIHAQDFRALGALTSAWNPEQPDAVYPEEDEILLVLDSQNPTGELSFTVRGADSRGGIQYVTPELWGYQPELPDDPVTGLMCYDADAAPAIAPPAEHIECEEGGWRE